MFWVRIKVAGKRIAFVCVHGPGMEWSENEREAFWECLNEYLSTCNENKSIELLGDMNAKVGNRTEDGVLEKYGVLGVNENGERLVEVCTERRMIIGNIWFKRRLIHKYTKEAKIGKKNA